MTFDCFRGMLDTEWLGGHLFWDTNDELRRFVLFYMNV